MRSIVISDASRRARAHVHRRVVHRARRRAAFTPATTPSSRSTTPRAPRSRELRAHRCEDLLERAFLRAFERALATTRSRDGARRARRRRRSTRARWSRRRRGEDETAAETRARAEAWTRAEAAPATTAFAEWIERGRERARSVQRARAGG